MVNSQGCIADASGKIIYCGMFGEASPNNLRGSGTVRRCIAGASPIIFPDKASGVHREIFQSKH